MKTSQQRRAALYDTARVAGLKGSAADAWVREQLQPPKPKPDPTPSLFGVELVRSALDRQKGQVR